MDGAHAELDGAHAELDGAHAELDGDGGLGADEAEEAADEDESPLNESVSGEGGLLLSNGAPLSFAPSTRGHHRRVISAGPPGLSALRAPSAFKQGSYAYSMSSAAPSLGPPARSVSFHLPGQDATSSLGVHEGCDTASRTTGTSHLVTSNMIDAEEYLSPLEALAAQQDFDEWRRRLVRNRWQLYWMLLKHPVLQGFRAHALDVKYAAKSQLLAQAKAGRDEPAWHMVMRKAKDGIKDGIQRALPRSARESGAVESAQLEAINETERESALTSTRTSIGGVEAVQDSARSSRTTELAF